MRANMDNLENALPTEEQPTQVEANEQDTAQWQRLSPIAILYFAVKFIIGLLGNVVYLAPAIIFGYDSIVANPLVWLPVVLGVLAVLTLSAFLSFYFFQYRLSKGHIEIRSGVFAKKYVNLPFERIQNVKIEQPIYYRPWHYACLQLDTAGSSKQEARVVALRLSFAETLKKEILTAYEANTHKEDLNVDLEGDTVEQSKEKLLNTRSLQDLVIHGLSNNRVWIFLGGLAPFFDDIGNWIADAFTSIGIDIEQLLTFANMPWWQIGLWALTLTFLILLPITLFSIAGSIISFYNFKLTKLDDKYIRRSGLFTKHEVTMRLARLQMIVRQQDWLDVLLKRINLRFEQSNANFKNLEPGAHNNKIIVPSIKEEECRFLTRDVYPDNKLFMLPFNSISRRYLFRNIVLIWAPLLLIPATVFSVAGALPVASGFFGAFVLMSVLTFCRWKRWGYAYDEKYIYVRKGQIGVDYYCFPRYKVQQTTFKQSKFLKPHKLCSIQFLLASGAVNIPFIPEEIGYKLLNETLYQLETSRLNWM